MNNLYCVYIMTNKSHSVLYTGVTSFLAQRNYQHKEKTIEGFTKKYHVDKLVRYEVFEDIREAIARERQIKGGSRQKKIDLINETNPQWRDLSNEL